MKKLLFITFLFTLFQLQGLGNRIDSLENETQNFVDGSAYSDRFMIYAQLREEYLAMADTQNVIESTLRMADMSRGIGNHVVALEFLVELASSGHTLSITQEIELYLIRGSIFYELDQTDSALFWARKGLSLSFKSDNLNRLPLLTNLLGACYKDTHADSSIKYIQISIDQFLNRNDSDGAVLPFLNLASLYFTHGDEEKALGITLESLDILNRQDIPIYRKMAYSQLAIIYKELKDYQNCVKYLGLRDSVNFVIHNNAIHFEFEQFQNLMEENQNELELARLQDQVDLIAFQNQANDRIITLGILALICLGISLFFAIKNAKGKKKQNQEILIQTSELDRLNRLKNKILSVISHDMRAPLAQVITFQHAKISGVNFSDSEIAEMDRTILAGTKNGLLILDNLLKWATSQFDGSPLKEEKFDSEFVIRQTLNQVSSLAREKKMTVSTKLANIEIFTEESLFQIILRNLLNNAIKFSPIASNITLVSRVTNQTLEIIIADQGPGIPEKVLTALELGLDIKAKSGTFGEKGAGIGLSFSKEFAARIGGSISFKKGKEVGTIVTFRLPLKT